MDSQLKQKITDDLKQALRTGEKTRISVIRMVLSSINYAQIAKQAELTDPDILGVIAKEIKQRNESIEAFKKGNRPDLASKEEAELAILQAYMPKQLTHDEVVAEVKKVIAEVGAQGIADKGKVMKPLMEKLKGKADGREINNIVTELLSH